MIKKNHTKTFDDVLEQYKQKYPKEFLFLNIFLRSCIYLFYPIYLLWISTYGQSLYYRDKNEWVNFIGTVLLNNFFITLILIFPMISVTWYIKKRLYINYFFINEKLSKIIDIFLIFYVKFSENLFIIVQFFNIFVLFLIAYDAHGWSYVIEVAKYLLIVQLIYLCIAIFAKYFKS